MLRAHGALLADEIIRTQPLVEGKKLPGEEKKEGERGEGEIQAKPEPQGLGPEEQGSERKQRPHRRRSTSSEKEKQARPSTSDGGPQATGGKLPVRRGTLVRMQEASPSEDHLDTEEKAAPGARPVMQFESISPTTSPGAARPPEALGKGAKGPLGTRTLVRTEGASPTGTAVAEPASKASTEAGKGPARAGTLVHVEEASPAGSPEPKPPVEHVKDAPRGPSRAQTLVRMEEASPKDSSATEPLSAGLRTAGKGPLRTRTMPHTEEASPIESPAAEAPSAGVAKVGKGPGRARTLMHVEETSPTGSPSAEVPSKHLLHLPSATTTREEAPNRQEDRSGHKEHKANMRRRDSKWKGCDPSSGRENTEECTAANGSVPKAVVKSAKWGEHPMRDKSSLPVSKTGVFQIRSLPPDMKDSLTPGDSQVLEAASQSDGSSQRTTEETIQATKANAAATGEDLGQEKYNRASGGPSMPKTSGDALSASPRTMAEAVSAGEPSLRAWNAPQDNHAGRQLTQAMADSAQGGHFDNQKSPLGTFRASSGSSTPPAHPKKPIPASARASAREPKLPSPAIRAGSSRDLGADN